MHSAFILLSILPFFLEIQLPRVRTIPILIHPENEFYLFLTGIQNNSQRSSHSQNTTAFSEAKRSKSCPADLLEPNLTFKEQLWDSEVS